MSFASPEAVTVNDRRIAVIYRPRPITGGLTSTPVVPHAALPLTTRSHTIKRRGYLAESVQFSLANLLLG